MSLHQGTMVVERQPVSTNDALRALGEHTAAQKENLSKTEKVMFRLRVS